MWEIHVRDLSQTCIQYSYWMTPMEHVCVDRSMYAWMTHPLLHMHIYKSASNCKCKKEQEEQARYPLKYNTRVTLTHSVILYKI